MVGLDTQDLCILLIDRTWLNMRKKWSTLGGKICLKIRRRYIIVLFNCIDDKCFLFSISFVL